MVIGVSFSSEVIGVSLQGSIVHSLPSSTNKDTKGIWEGWLNRHIGSGRRVWAREFGRNIGT